MGPKAWSLFLLDWRHINSFIEDVIFKMEIGQHVQKINGLWCTYQCHNGLIYPPTLSGSLMGPGVPDSYLFSGPRCNKPGGTATESRSCWISEQVVSQIKGRGGVVVGSAQYHLMK